MTALNARWLVEIDYVDGETQLMGFSDEAEARRFAAGVRAEASDGIRRVEVVDLAAFKDRAG